MKLTLTAIGIIAFFFATLSAQQPKGVSGLNPIRPEGDARTRAVIIGISDYQDPGIPDLRFSDRDAEAFAGFLRSPAGGSVPDEQLMMLQNEKATNARMADALIWLLEESQAGDRAIIYFSGHGDVETITRFNRGYLLTYDSPPKVYMAGALNVRDLQDIISTMSDREVQVLMISDACRAGKLAGSEVGGTAATAQNLAKQFANEAKILSCQPDEFSLEGEQWGGGRGVFSYHLLDGLYGLADRNGDGLVDLFEIGRYLEDRVPRETAPHNQMPFTMGDRKIPVATVNEESLAQLKARKAEEAGQQLTSIETKGVEEAFLTHSDSNVLELYHAFLTALERKQLLEPRGRSAYALYQSFSNYEEFRELGNLMRRNLAVALQEDAQQAINAYLVANPKEIQRRFENEADYSLYPRYLGKAAELLGPDHFYYDDLLVNQYYFEGLGLRLEGRKQPPETRDSIYFQALLLQKKALELDPASPYVLNELGVLHILLRLDQKALPFLEKAMALSPEWGLPYINYAVGLFYNDEVDKAVEYGEKAGTLLSDFPQVYAFLAWINANNWQYSDKTMLPREGIELQDSYKYEVDEMSTREQLIGRYSTSIELLEKAIEADSSYRQAYKALAYLTSRLEQFEKALQYQKKAVELEPDDPEGHAWLGMLYSYMNEFEASEKAFLKAIELDPGNLQTNNNLSAIYIYWKKWNKVIESANRALHIKEAWQVYSNKAFAYEQLGNMEAAEAARINMVRLSQNFPRAYTLAGRFYWNIHRYREAEWLLLEALDTKSDYLHAILTLSSLYQETGQLTKAETWIRRTLSNRKHEPSLLIALGKIKYLQGEEAIAEEHFSDAYQMDTLSGTNLWQIGNHYFLQGDYGKAEHWLKKAYAIIEGPPGNLAQLLYQTDRKEECFELMEKQYPAGSPHFKLAISIFAASHGEIATSLDFARQAGETIEIFLPFVEIWEAYDRGDLAATESLLSEALPELHNSYQVLLAQLRVKLGQYDKALDLIESALSDQVITHFDLTKNPNFDPLRKKDHFQTILRQYFPGKYGYDPSLTYQLPSPIYFGKNCANLADFYFEEGEPERSEALFDKALELEPKSATVHFYWVRYLNRSQQYEQVAEMPEYILQSEHVKVQYWLGRAFYLLGRKDEAFAHHQKVMELEPGNVVMARSIGGLYLEHFEPALARNYLEAASKLDPETPLPRELLAFLTYLEGQREEAFTQLRQLRESPYAENRSWLLEIFLRLQNEEKEEARSVVMEAASKWPEFLLMQDFLDALEKASLEEAREAYEALLLRFSLWEGSNYLKYLYLELLLEAEEPEKALELLREILDSSKEFITLSVELIRSDADLAPLAEMQAFQELMAEYFPNG